MLTHASTILANTPRGLLKHLSHINKTHPRGTLLFTLSANAPHLSDLVAALTALSPTSSVGCLAAPSLDAPSKIACSLAWFDALRATPFRSTLPGRPAPQVGRWHAFRRRMEDRTPGGSDQFVNIAEDGEVDWEDVWARSAGESPLPAEISQIPPNDVHTVLYLSDGAPEGFTNALRAFPRATKLGMLASATPFVTGRPVTLFSGTKIHSSGAVGLALHGPTKTEALVRFPGLNVITKNLNVTRSEGNLVQELDSTNPSRLLLQAIQRAVHPEAAKNDEFYLGVLDSTTGDLAQVYRITSGDPSRGTMALESGAAPSVGSTVQLLHRSTGSSHLTPPSAGTSPATLNRSILTFSTSLWDGDVDVAGNVQKLGDVTEVTDGAFVAASENGFLLSRGTEETWTCKVPSAEASLSFDAST